MQDVTVKTWLGVFWSVNLWLQFKTPNGTATSAGDLIIITGLRIPHTWMIIPFSKWLITMLSRSPKDRGIPLPNGRNPWLINGGDPNHLRRPGMILQVPGISNDLIGGRWYIITKLAVDTPYIPLIYCLLGGLNMLPIPPIKGTIETAIDRGTQEKGHQWQRALLLLQQMRCMGATW